MPRTSLKIAKQVMESLKQKVKSSHDIISFEELPFVRMEEMNDYIARFGLIRMTEFLEHQKITSQIRSLVQQLLPLYDKTTRSVSSLFKVATTFCGIGECDETSQRAVMELLAKGCDESLNLIVLSGMPYVTNPNPDVPTDYYSHMLIIIGSLQGRLNSDPQKFFKDLPSDHILFDASLKLIGPANQTATLLKSVFKHFKINNVAMVVEINPTQDRVAYGESQLAKAKEFSTIILEKFKPIRDKKIIPRDRLFSYPEKKYRSVEDKPTSLLVDDKAILDWDTCMQSYERRMNRP